MGYVEISNAERPQAQLKLALDNGSGSGKIKIPADAPSGIYELSGYTQYMRNEGEKIFFRKQIAITTLSGLRTDRNISRFYGNIPERSTGYERKHSYKHFPAVV